MGYTHYWHRVPVFTEARYRKLVQDATSLLAFFTAHDLPICGPNGRGPPLLTPKRLTFNGDASCSHARRALGITWPAKDASGVALVHTQGSDQPGQPIALLRQLQEVATASGTTVYSEGRAGRDASTDSDVAGQWFAGAELRSRTCGGDCSHEDFVLPCIFDTRGCEHEDGRYFDCCKTAYKPYDLAAQCVLIIAKLVPGLG